MKKKINLKKLFIILLIIVPIGFAVLTSNLNIKGNFSFLENSFNIYLDKLEIVNSTLELPSVNIDNKESLSLTGNFKKPGDYIEFSFYAINDGTIDAELNNIEVTEIATSIESYFSKSIQYFDGTETLKGDYLQAGSARKLIVKIEYKYDIENFVSVENLVININVSYIQSKTSDINTWNYEFIDQEQYFIIPKTGTYKLEVWGAQGGGYNEYSVGGYGGYSVGNYKVNKGEIIYIHVGNVGNIISTHANMKAEGGYNGGGSGYGYVDKISGGGGGATHISFSSGILSTLSGKINSIIIVAGGGGGGVYTDAFSDLRYGLGGSGGGFKGKSGTVVTTTASTPGTGGSQTSGGLSPSIAYNNDPNGYFGLGGSTSDNNGCGAGGGYYGGGAGFHDAGCGGGSGYIGNPLLENKSMYCYECEESSEETTKTISTTNVSEIATSQYAKKGNGYAKITYLS